MKTVKLAIKYLIYGISYGCTFFVFFCLLFLIIGGAEYLRPITEDFARQAVGAMIVGIACGSTAIVYQFERLSFWQKTLIHFIVGVGTFYPTAIYLGWIPFYPKRLSYTVLQILGSCAIFMAIWFGFYLFNRHEVKKINGRLRELERHYND